MSVVIKRISWLALAAALLAACQAQPTTSTARRVTVLDGERITVVQDNDSPVGALLQEAGVTLSPSDWVLADGVRISTDKSEPVQASMLQVRRAVPVTLINNGKKTEFESAAHTVGEALDEQGIKLFAADVIDPPASTPILGPVSVTLSPSREIKVETAHGEVLIRSAAGSVGAALARAGLALQGSDYSIPNESAPLPTDGKIKVVRVSETVLLAQKSIPFNTQYELSADLELDQQDLLQAGETGLAINRVRVRYEDGQEVSRETEPETTVRQPKDRVVGTGTKVVIRTVDTPSGPREYWRKLYVYATSYSPCRSGGTRCYTGTAGGLPVRRGVIGVVRRWWYSMNGLQVYVPGYGAATISDIGGGIPGTPWIDLGFSDQDYESWHQWVTIYFLTPVPPSILYDLE